MPPSANSTGMIRLYCKAALCGEGFVPTPTAVRLGYPLRKGEWSFLSNCPHCGVVFDYTVENGRR